MFPQSELDNYKLQVELLQKKLQRSEISRQQLEHKLDKILQKRDEHEKFVRSKARQKYEQILEEQQRRNERNKQLVQMLERIEQQTEVLNARSERLKMMKLQYEMYFAKLVHTQTRRCIQSSVQPMTHFMAASAAQPMWSAVQQSALEGHNYKPNVETTTTPLDTNNSYQNFVAATQQEENVAMKTSDSPALTQFTRKEHTNNGIDAKYINMPPQWMMYQSSTKTETVQNMTDIPANYACNIKQESPDNTSYNETNPSVAYLLNKDKKLPESKDHRSNLLTTTASSSFADLTNEAMMPPQKLVHAHTLHELPKSSKVLNSNNDGAPNNYISNFSTAVQPPLNSPPSQGVNEMPLKSTNTNVQDARNLKQSPKTIELKNNDIKMPNQYQTPSTATSLQSDNNFPNSSNTETCLSSSKNKIYLQKQSASIEQPIEDVTPAAASPVSIENIENKIYGELLLPLEAEEVDSQETASVASNLLENLVTQSENNEISSAEQTQLKQETTFLQPSEEYNDANEQNQNSYNYEQNPSNKDFNNVQQSVAESAQNFADYNTNVESGESDEIQQQQQQQQEYDYSNYDPTQYSYPGYVYDETTGEYKPDPNAPLEQYATDQQYAAEGYEQQQQQQYQQSDYDYNQTYAEQATALTTTDENTVNNDYDATQNESSSPSSSLSKTDTNIIQQQVIAQPEPTLAQAVVAPEEVATLATSKVLKPTSILSSADKTETQKKKKRVNFIDSSETDESTAAAAVADEGTASSSKPINGNLAASSESDFDFSSSTEAEAKGT